MAINMWKIRKWAGLLVTSMLPTLMFFVALNIWGFMFSILFFIAGSIIASLLGSFILKNPFTSMLEGKGILTLAIDSTGVIRPFISAINQPYVKGKLGSEFVNDVYDASAVMRMAEPVKAGAVKPNHSSKSEILLECKECKKAVKGGEGGIFLRLTENEFNKSRFALYQYPVLIYNAQIKSCITKDFISEQEKLAFAEHGVLYLNRKVEELTSTMRDFGRYIVELTKPKSSLWENRWVRIVVIGLVVLFIGLMAKPLYTAFVGAGGGGGIMSSLSGAVTPR